MTPDEKKAFRMRDEKIDLLRSQLQVAEKALRECDVAIKAIRVLREEMRGVSAKMEDYETTASKALRKIEVLKNRSGVK